MRRIQIARFSELEDRQPIHALVGVVDLVIVKYNDEISVLYGRCLHRGALLADGHIDGHNLICGVHNWDYRYDTGISEYHNEERLEKFTTWIEDDRVLVDEDEILRWEKNNPQPYKRDEYQGEYQDIHGTPDEPYVDYIRHLASHGLSKVGHHGRVGAMGVPRDELPKWDGLQFVTAQLHKFPQLDDVEVGTELVIGPRAGKPLTLDIPNFCVGHEFWRAVCRGENRLSTGRRDGGYRDMFRRGWYAPGGTG